MNRAARLIKGLPRRESIPQVLIDLHWLPVKARVIYKICFMAYQALQFGTPKYINELLRDFHLDTPKILNQPILSLNIGFRAFASCPPILYNKLQNKFQ